MPHFSTEFPAPVAVEVRPKNQSRVLVAWQHPQHSRTPLRWFIVEWVSTAHYGQEEQYFWKKVPYQETQTYLPGKRFQECFCYLVQFLRICKKSPITL